ncbi:Pin2-interacting protein X1 [Microdochium nivale]|nr:Pin2-interacting protein X1 [Microdochium nivale]
MGLSGPKNKRKLNEDPNNTRWSRDETTFGQRILRAHGWEPGSNLGAKDAAHASYHTSASSAPIKVVVKDDFLGLGAKVRQKQSDECTGLDVFKDLLGRLNGKSEESIDKERKARTEIKTNLYVENKFGLMRFVSGGLLVGDQMQDLVTKKEENTVKTEPEDVKVKEETSDSERISLKKDKKSKKRKAEEAEQDETPKEKSRDKKKRKKPDTVKEEGSSDELSKTKKKKSKSAAESDDDSAKSKDKKKKRREKKTKETAAGESGTPSDVEDAEKRRKREKKEKKEKKRRRQEVAETTASSAPMVVDTPDASGTATPVETGTSTPTAMSARHYARSRNIASKRQAIADMKSMNQIFMVKPV